MRKLLSLLLCLAAPAFSENEPAISYSKLRDVMVQARDTLPASYNMMERDAFGRLRVSMPTSLLNSKHLRDKQSHLWSEYVTGLANASYMTNDSMIVMTVSNNGTAIRQTYQHFNYQAGKSQLVLMTGIIDPKRMTGDARVRMGQFTADPNSVTNTRGLWFEADATNVYVCIGKALGTGVGVRRIPRERWNEDKVDGDGPSKTFVDFSKAQIFGFDYEWLGAGAVRFFIIQDNKVNVIHRFKHANELNAPYLSTPNLQLRYDLHATSGTGSMYHICSAVFTEPNETPLGLSYFVGNASNISYSTTYGILSGFRMTTNHMDRSYLTKSITTLNTDNVANYQWLLTLDTVYTGAVTWVTAPSNVGLDVVNPTAEPGITDLGIVLASGFVAADSSSEFDPVDLLKIGSNIAGQSQSIYLIVRAISGTPELSGGINLQIVE